jgi:hypothetical protein
MLFHRPLCNEKSTADLVFDHTDQIRPGNRKRFPTVLCLWGRSTGSTHIRERHANMRFKSPLYKVDFSFNLATVSMELSRSIL